MDGAGRAAMDGGFCVFAELTVFPERGTRLKAASLTTMAY